MSRRRRKDNTSGTAPGDGEPYPPSASGHRNGPHSDEQANPFAPRAPGQADPDPATRGPYGSGPQSVYGSSGYGQGGGFFGRQGGGLIGPGMGGASAYGDAGSRPGGAGSGGHGSSGPGGPEDGTGPRSAGDGHRRRARRRSPGALIGPLAGVMGLALLVGAGVYALIGGGCGGAPVDLKVVAAPDIAPVINDIGMAFNRERHSVDGRCVMATVTAFDPAGTSTLLAGQSVVPGEVAPDVWIPDSSLWVDLVRSSPKGASNVHQTPTAVAQTPIVPATSRNFAARIKDQGIRPSWKALFASLDAGRGDRTGKNPLISADSVNLQILDPTRSAGGLGTLVMTRMLLQGDPDADMTFTQIVRKVQNRTSPDTEALFAGFHRNPHGRAPVVVAPEQAVWKYNRRRPPIQAAAIYPSEGAFGLDHPYTLTTDDDVKVRAAGLLEEAMSTPRAKATVHALGFRTPDGRAGEGFGSGGGLSARVPRLLPVPSPSDVTDVSKAWTKLSLRSRMLTLLDVSGSMAQPVGRGLTRMQATAQVAQRGLAELPDDTDLGLWTFSTGPPGTRDYRTEVPIGPLSTRLGSGTRRQAILTALGRVRPNPAGDTGLYDSVLASFRSMQRSYKVGYYNSVLVLTDGRNDDLDGISLAGLLRTLKKENDPGRPVMIVFIGFGPEVDMTSMRRIAAETNGAAYHATKPEEIQQIFAHTIARRICAPDCH